MLIHFHGNLNELNIKYESYPKSRKITAFVQQICIYPSPNNNKQCLLSWSI